MGIPSDEELTLVLTVQEAFGLAEEGSPAAGFMLLLRLSRRAWQANLDGHAWGADLATAYREAIKRYTERFPVPTPHA
jgi:hypothetical protein